MYPLFLVCITWGAVNLSNTTLVKPLCGLHRINSRTGINRSGAAGSVAGEVMLSCIRKGHSATMMPMVLKPGLENIIVKILRILLMVY